MLVAEELVVSGEKALKVAGALNVANFKILKAIQKESLYISSLARILGYTESYISEKIALLEELGLVNIKYERGKRGIRKIASSKLGRLVINLEDEDT